MYSRQLPWHDQEMVPRTRAPFLWRCSCCEKRPRRLPCLVTDPCDVGDRTARQTGTAFFAFSCSCCFADLASCEPATVLAYSPRTGMYFFMYCIRFIYIHLEFIETLDQPNGRFYLFIYYLFLFSGDRVFNTVGR